ncbi:MAG: hypothetical protein JOY95_06170 [Silvibacterium sp.]|nr:hypothetical protein [Silvibacterium sp.]MBV8630594.1 hypothetical protein [Silvibacterium sp.]
MKKTVSVKDLKGIVPKPKKPVSIEDMERAIGDAVLERWRRSELRSGPRKARQKTSSE